MNVLTVCHVLSTCTETRHLSLRVNFSFPMYAHAVLLSFYSILLDVVVVVVSTSLLDTSKGKISSFY